MNENLRAAADAESLAIREEMRDLADDIAREDEMGNWHVLLTVGKGFGKHHSMSMFLSKETAREIVETHIAEYGNAAGYELYDSSYMCECRRGK